LWQSFPKAGRKAVILLKHTTSAKVAESQDVWWLPNMMGFIPSNDQDNFRAG